MRHTMFFMKFLRFFEIELRVIFDNTSVEQLKNLKNKIYNILLVREYELRYL